MKRRQILSSKSLSEDEKNTRLQDLMLRNPLGSGPPLSIEDLGYPPHTHTHTKPTLASEEPRCDLLPLLRLNFQFCPSSKVHGFSAVDLKPNGDNEVRAGPGQVQVPGQVPGTVEHLDDPVCV